MLIALATLICELPTKLYQFPQDLVVRALGTQLLTVAVRKFLMTGSKACS